MDLNEHFKEKFENKMNRRQFLIRAGKAGGLIAVSSALGLFLYDSKGPTGEEKSDLFQLSDYSIPELGKKMAIVKGEDRKATVTKAIDALGGMEKFITKGDKVLLKVNAAFASPAILSATTNPDLIAKVIELCLKAGASEVRVTDNPINDPESCFKLTGIADAVKSAGGKLILPKESYFKPISVEGGQLIRNWPFLYKPLVDVDKVIGIAPVKDHQRSGASMCMKNWYGLLGGRRNTFHQDIHNIIKELAMMIKPTLVILDGTTTMMTNGPTGGAVSDLKNTNTMIVSTDQVAADAFGCTLLGKTVGDLPYITKAAALKLGTSDYQSLKPIMI